MFFTVPFCMWLDIPTEASCTHALRVQVGGGALTPIFCPTFLKVGEKPRSGKDLIVSSETATYVR